MTSCPLYNNSNLSNTSGNPYALGQKGGKRRTKRRMSRSKSRTMKIKFRKTKAHRKSRGFIY